MAIKAQEVKGETIGLGSALGAGKKVTMLGPVRRTSPHQIGHETTEEIAPVIEGERVIDGAMMPKETVIRAKANGTITAGIMDVVKAVDGAEIGGEGPREVTGTGGIPCQKNHSR
eukprot:GHVT01007418.1.p2 GENE.GHVT01007418.1~~GHVT01007418.1.p2  ORF type:complete len:115 (+),score=8.03 GHVT01007418.1:2-346(+)